MGRGELKPNEPHPSALSALAYVRSIPLPELCAALEAFSSCAIEGNQLAEVCGETLRRLLHSEPVSDRYLLGLAWCLREQRGDGPPSPTEQEP
jgi:hypothetical protein